MPKAEINGRPATSDELATLAFASYGHYTSMEVRDGKVRGLDLHLSRLRASAQELFGRPLDEARTREFLRHAIGNPSADVSVRINVFSFDTRAIWSGRTVEPDVLIRVSPPVPADSIPIRVQSVSFQRFLPHLKNVATMGLAYHARLARGAGFDDVLFIDRHGFVSEGSVWNVAFLDGGDVVWPNAPALPGIALLLAQQGSQRLGIPNRMEPIHVSSVGSFRAAALISSITAGQPIAEIDGAHFAGQDNEVLVRLLHRAQDAFPMEPV